MTYRYRAYTPDKKVIAGTIDAASETVAEEALYEAGYTYVLELKSAVKGSPIEAFLPSLFGVRTQDIIEFSRQLAAFLESGVSLITAMQLLEEQITKPAMKRVITEVIKALQNGSSFSQAVSLYPAVFPYSYVQVIKASEQAGELENGLKQISEYLDRQAKVKHDIGRALTYPAIIIIMAIGVFILLVTVVMPPMFKLYSSLNAELPSMTLIAMSIFNFFINYGLYTLVAIIALGGAFMLFARLPAGKSVIDEWFLKLPVIGAITIHRTLGQFSRTAAMLLRSGLQLPVVLDVAIRTVSSNTTIIKALEDLREKLVQGESLSRSMSENPFFPGMMTRMIAMGEQTGGIESALMTLANYYEDKSHERVKSLVSMIEPALTTVIGIGVAFLLLATILPLYTILRTLH